MKLPMSTIDAHDFAYYCECYGANLSRWPQPTRSGAAFLLRNSLDARRAWRQAEELDRILATAPRLAADNIMLKPGHGLANIMRFPTKRSSDYARLAPHHRFISKNRLRRTARQQRNWPAFGGILAALVLFIGTNYAGSDTSFLAANAAEDQISFLNDTMAPTSLP